MIHNRYLSISSAKPWKEKEKSAHKLLKYADLAEKNADFEDACDTIDLAITYTHSAIKLKIQSKKSEESVLKLMKQNIKNMTKRSVLKKETLAQQVL